MNFGSGGPPQYHLLDFGRIHQQFMNTHPAPIASLQAIKATWRLIKGKLTLLRKISSPFFNLFLDVLFIRICLSATRNCFAAKLGGEEVDFFVIRFVGLLAGCTQGSGKPLGKNSQNRIGEVEGIHAHIQQPYNTLGGTVGMQGRENQVAC